MRKTRSSAEAEFGAQFRTDIEAYVSREAVEAVVEWGVHERGHCSASATLHSSIRRAAVPTRFALAVAHKEGDIGVLDAIREVRPPFSPEAVITEFADLLKTYRITKVIGDRYARRVAAREIPQARHQLRAEQRPQGRDLSRTSCRMLNSGKVKLLGNKRLDLPN